MCECIRFPIKCCVCVLIGVPCLVLLILHAIYPDATADVIQYAIHRK